MSSPGLIARVQGWQPIETLPQSGQVLVTDDASPDETLRVCARFQAIRYIRREDNMGRVANYRQTLADARGAGYNALQATVAVTCSVESTA